MAIALPCESEGVSRSLMLLIAEGARGDIYQVSGYETVPDKIAVVL